MRAHDWTSTPLGDPETWPSGLRTAIRLLLNSANPMHVFWGPEAIFFYNDAFIPSAGAERHPSALGLPASESWGEIWPIIGPDVAKVLNGGGHTWYEDRHVPILRQGRLEDAYWTYGFNPIDDETAPNGIGGVISILSETTKSKALEGSLRASEKRQRALLQQMPGFVAVLEGSGHVYAYVNDAYVATAGPRQYLGRSVRDVFPELQGQGFYELLDEVFATGVPFSAQATPIRFEGEDDRYIDFLFQPIRGDDGTVTGVFVGGHEVTGRVRAEAALRDERDQARGLEAAARADAERVQLALGARAIIGTWFFDVPNDRFTVDEGFATAFGLDPALGREGIPLAGIVATVHPDDRAGLAQAIDEALARGGRYEHQYRVRRTDGRYYWIEANGRVDLAPDGAPESFPGVLLDIEERRAVEAERERAVAALRELNADLERKVTERAFARGRTWQVSPDILGVLNADGYFEESNPAWAASLGWSFEEVASTVFFDFIHPDDQAATRAAWKDAIDRGIPALRFENRYRHKDGTWRWLSWVAVPDDGKVYCAARDITAGKEQAVALSKAEEALRHSQKMEAVGQLTGGVAHDFNNLLTIIRSSVDLLRRPGVAEARKRLYLDAVSDTVDRAAKLTGQLLAFARRQALQPEVFDVGAKLRGVGDMLDTVTGARIKVTLAIPDEPRFAHADLSQFETALVNLAVNARDAMDGEGCLTLRLASVTSMPSIRAHAAADGAFVAISMVDTGTGIAPDQVARIFEPFFTTKGVGKGTGLGLSQVFGFAKQSGGDVDVSSEVGAGTTFTLYLPERAAMPVYTAAEDAAVPMAPTAVGQRVLVVEDNIEVGRFCTQILQDLGYVTEWCVNAEDALVRLGDDGGGFDAVFSDVVMPGMGGVALAETLRERLPAMPVVLASGYSHVLAHENDHSFELLHKPYSAEQLARVLRRVMARRFTAGTRVAAS